MLLDESRDIFVTSQVTVPVWLGTAPTHDLIIKQYLRIYQCYFVEHNEYERMNNMQDHKIEAVII